MSRESKLDYLDGRIDELDNLSSESRQLIQLETHDAALDERIGAEATVFALRPHVTLFGERHRFLVCIRQRLLRGFSDILHSAHSSLFCSCPRLPS